MIDGCARDATSLNAKVGSTTELLSLELRPGVTFPDWSAVTSPAARDALTAILSAIDPAERWSGYGEEEDRVRQAVTEGLAKLDHGPDTAWIACRTGLEEGHVEALLESLAARDLVVRDDNNAVVGAYPLTTRSTEHRLEVGGRVVRAMCAVDALGTGAMFGTDVVIDSRCRACGGPIEIATSDRGIALGYVEPGSTVVWSGIQYERACAATSLCTVIAYFCSEAHLEGWRRANHPGAAGYRLTPDEAMQVGRALFAPVFRPAAGTVGWPA